MPTIAPRSVCGQDIHAGTAIGWDWAAYGLQLPERYGGAALDGFLAGSHHFRRSTLHPHDRFVRKHLQLRTNAWVRNRIFDPGVTPNYLRWIDVTHCPVTREELTHGELRPSDWSVDRCWNDGAYAPGNLVVMSTRANLAKGRKSPTDILQIVVAGESREGLDHLQWARLAAIVAMAVDETSALPMLVAPPPKMLIANRWTPIQYSLSMAAGGRMSHRAIADARAACHGKDAKRRFDRFMHVAERLIYHASARATDDNGLRWALADAWMSPALLQVFRELADSLSAADRLGVLNACRRHYVGFRQSKADPRQTWGLETLGYCVPA